MSNRKRKVVTRVPIDPDVEKARLGISNAMDRYSGAGYDAVYYALEVALASIASVNAAIHDARLRRKAA